jgi:hypothetical protein
MSTSAILSAMRQEVASILQEKVANVVGDVVHAAESAPARGAAGRLGQMLSKGKGRLAAVGQHLHKHEDAYDLGGLGVLGGVTAAEVGQHVKKDAVTGKRDLHGAALGGAELAGLGVLAAPVAAKMMLSKAAPLAHAALHK